ncbi:hypothetical protein [Nitrosococcus wardiae]|uniref:Uncharacterized protein n=1 Tax=Nitrosococcus wardiae TaxID=1814290 RepID=A0A4V1AVW3_9GAMM|nr:hypothetical protein [Nitrosococcus wardiae]QBQ54535.1 hypothetical protein E3U44_08450 [Nitrosococcus wardiae]
MTRPSAARVSRDRGSDGPTQTGERPSPEGASWGLARQARTAGVASQRRASRDGLTAYLVTPAPSALGLI